MKTIKRSNELLWVLGVLCVALGVAVCSKANLGVSMIAAPAFVLHEALSPLWSGFSVGVLEYLVQGVLLITMCLVTRRFDWRYLLAFAVAVVYGYVLDLFLWLLQDVTVHAIALRWLMLLTGDVCVAFGVACCFRTYMPLQVYELFVAELSARFGWSIGKVKSGFDAGLLLLSLILAFSLFGDVTTFDWSTITHTSFHSIGLGTLVTTLINSPLISLMGRLIDRCFEPTPLFPCWQVFLKRTD